MLEDVLTGAPGSASSSRHPISGGLRTRETQAWNQPSRMKRASLRQGLWQSLDGGGRAPPMKEGVLGESRV